MLRGKNEIMKKNYTLLNCGFALLFLISACAKVGPQCQNSYALNYNPDVEALGGATCNYSNAVFFIQSDSILRFDTAFGLSSTGSDSILFIRRQYIHIDAAALPLTLYMDGNQQGQIQSVAAIFPNSCDKTALPSAQYKVVNLADSTLHTWTAVGNGNSYVFSGTVRANSTQSCIPVPIQ